MTKYSLSNDDLRKHLERRIRLLRSFVAAYDAGEKDQIYPVSTALRSLLHDSDKSTSLAERLGLKNRPFVDASCGPRPPPPASGGKRQLLWPGLCMFHNGGAGWSVVPAFQGGLPVRGKLAFQAWWTAVCADVGPYHQFSRKDFVLTMANKEDAHVDLAIPQKYRDVAIGEGVPYAITAPDGSRVPLGDLEKAAVRQVAHEVLLTLG